MKLRLLSPVLSLLFAVAAVQAQQKTVTIATVNNPDMIELKKLSPKFEAKNPDIKLNWVIVEENVLRQRVTTDVSTGSGQFDIVFIGLYETPIFAKRGWLRARSESSRPTTIWKMSSSRFGTGFPIRGSSMRCRSTTIRSIKRPLFAAATLQAMQTADPTNPCIKPVPYTGIQFVGIPEFQSIGTVVGQNISGALSGKLSIDQALKDSQAAAERAVKQDGYLK
jgi:ABC-type glycerol-3-phosphate transport system substrate-binding protein